MPKSNNSTSDKRLKRIFEVHKCLRDKPYKTEELLRKVAKIDNSVNERTIKSDIEFLRNLGANIPKGNKHHGFQYKKPFSILESLEGKKTAEIDEIVAFIQQLNDKSPAFLGLDNVLIALEQRLRISDARQNPYLDFEKVESEGIKKLDEFYRYITTKRVYEIAYTPFGKELQKRIILPLLLKEYNHRWTLIAFDKKLNGIQNFPLERIGKVTLSAETLSNTNGFDGTTYFKNVIGITINEKEIETIKFKISKPRAYYIQTKRIHHSQIELGNDEFSIIFQIKIIPNNEMWAKFMELVEDLEIIQPIELKNELKERIKKIYERM